MVVPEDNGAEIDAVASDILEHFGVQPDVKDTPTEPIQTANPPKADQGAEGQKPEPAGNEDPEVEVSAGKKVKMSELKAGYLRNEDYTSKTQKLSEDQAKMKDTLDWVKRVSSNQKLAKAVDSIVSKAFTDENAEQYLDGLLSHLEGKKEQIQDAKDEIDELLSELPQDDPYAQALRHNREMIRKAMAQINTAITAAKQTPQQAKAEDPQATQQDKAAITDEGRKAVDDAIGESAKAAGVAQNDGQYKFWRSAVVAELNERAKDGSITSIEQLKSLAVEAGKKVAGELKAYLDAQKAEYIKSKESLLPHGASVSGAGGRQPQEISMDNLDDVIEKNLNSLISEREGG